MTDSTARVAQSKQFCRSSLITVTDSCDGQQDNQDKGINSTHFRSVFKVVFFWGGGKGRWRARGMPNF